MAATAKPGDPDLVEKPGYLVKKPGDLVGCLSGDLESFTGKCAEIMVIPQNVKKNFELLDHSLERSGILVTPCP